MNSLKIGITSGLRTDEEPSALAEVLKHYAALGQMGASPIILRTDMNPHSLIGDLRLQGIVFSGGGDIAASRYGGNELLANDLVNLARDAFEFSLFEVAYEAGVPVLAVCRGMQVANVALGGTLIEDLKAYSGSEYRIKHHQIKDNALDGGMDTDKYAHNVRLVKETRLHEIIQRDRCLVNSLHHQAVKDLAPSLRVGARADDGVVEAVEYVAKKGATERWFFLGVQWHPERLIDDPASTALYRRFIRECSSRASRGFQDAR